MSNRLIVAQLVLLSVGASGCFLLHDPEGEPGADPDAGIDADGGGDPDVARSCDDDWILGDPCAGTWSCPGSLSCPGTQVQCSGGTVVETIHSCGGGDAGVEPSPVPQPYCSEPAANGVVIGAGSLGPCPDDLPAADLVSVSPVTDARNGVEFVFEPCDDASCACSLVAEGVGSDLAARMRLPIGASVRLVHANGADGGFGLLMYQVTSSCPACADIVTVPLFYAETAGAGVHEAGARLSTIGDEIGLSVRVGDELCRPLDCGMMANALAAAAGATYQEARPGDETAMDSRDGLRFRNVRSIHLTDSCDFGGPVSPDAWASWVIWADGR